MTRDLSGDDHDLVFMVNRFLLPCTLPPITDEMLYSLIHCTAKDFLFAYLQTTESLVAQCKVGDEGILRWCCNGGQATWVASVHENCRSKSVTRSSCPIVLVSTDCAMSDKMAGRTDWCSSDIVKQL